MESVEELCDYIALINKSNKILDGKLSEIKQKFKTNQFEVGLISNEKEQLLAELNEHYKTEKSISSQLADELRLIITLNNGDTSKDLIRFLNNKAQLNHFTEIIPSANDIFLKAVANNG